MGGRRLTTRRRQSSFGAASRMTRRPARAPDSWMTVPGLSPNGAPATVPALALRCVALSQYDGRDAMNRPDAFVRRCKRYFVRWLAAVVALLASAGAVQAETLPRIVMNSDLKIIDPIWNTAFVIRDHGYMIYDTLFATDAEGEIRPQMVDRTETSADKLTYTFTLRDGLKWHDGAPVTAEDCVASIRRWAARDTVGQKLMTFVLDVAARDARTIGIRLHEPPALLRRALGKPTSNAPSLMPRRIAETDPFTQITDSTGSGPFILKRDQWRPRPNAAHVPN